MRRSQAHAQGFDLPSATVLALLVVAVGALVGPVKDAFATGDGFDFASIWLAGHRVTQGLSPWNSSIRVGDFVQIPSTALWMTPFGTLDLETARLVMVGVASTCAVVACVAPWLSRTGDLRWAGAGITLLVLATSSGMPEELRLGNTDLVAAAFLASGVALMHQRSPRLAGLAIGLGLSVKPTMGLLLLLPLLGGSLTGTLVAGATLLGFNLVGLLVISDPGRFLTSALPYILDGSTGGYNTSLSASLERLGFPPALVLAARILSVILLVVGAFRYRSRLKESPAAIAALLILTTSFLSAYFFARYYVYLVVAAPSALGMLKSRTAAVIGGSAVVLLLGSFNLRTEHQLLDDLLGLRYVAGSLCGIAAISIGLSIGRPGDSRPSPTPRTPRPG